MIPTNLFDSIIVLDCETGGLDPGKHALLQVALVASRGRELELNVFTGGDVTEQALKVNGIDLDKHEGLATPTADACSAVRNFLEDVRKTAPGGKLIAAGHHTAFDLAFLNKLFAPFDVPCPLSTYRSLDTQTLLFQEHLSGHLPPDAMGLNAACKHYGIEHDAVHTALGDARATRKLLVNLLFPNCHEKDGIIVRNTQVLREGRWVNCELQYLSVGDVFRQTSDEGGWQPPYVAVEKAFPEGDLGNFGIKADEIHPALYSKIGIPT